MEGAPSSSVRWLIVIALTSASASVVIAIASASATPGKTRATLPLAQLVALAKTTASGLNDPRVKTALVAATTKHAAEEWLEPGAISPGAADPRAYVIVLKGRFICTRCSYPAGAKPPARVLGANYLGSRSRGQRLRTDPASPWRARQARRVVKINLLAPAVTAPDQHRRHRGRTTAADASTLVSAGRREVRCTSQTSA